MELLHLPLREVKQRFTKSEMFILAWRSSEQYHQMMKRLKETETGKKTPRKGGKFRKENPLLPDNLPDECFDEEGDLNLSKLPGEKAARYLNALGWRVPIIGGIHREKAEDTEALSPDKKLNSDEVGDILNKIR